MVVLSLLTCCNSECTQTQVLFCYCVFCFVCFAGLMLISDTDRYIILTPFGQCSFPRVSYVFKI